MTARPRFIVLVLAAFAAACHAPARSSDDTYSREAYGWRADDGWNEWAMVHLAQREFDDRSLPEGDNHFGLGLELAGAPYGAWLALEFGLWSSSSRAGWTRWGEVFRGLDSDDLDIGSAESRSFELSLGVRKEVRPFGGPIALVAGGGVAMVQLEEAALDIVFTEDDDADFGLYGHAGAFYEFDSPARLGVGVRGVEGTEHRLSGRDASGDYLQWSLVVSFFF